MRVSDIMTREVVTAPESATLGELAALLLERDVGSVVIVDPAGGDVPVGIVTESDFVPHEHTVPRAFPLARAAKVFDEWVQSSEDLEDAYARWRSRPARDVMSAPVHVIADDAEVWEAAHAMCERRVDHVPVVRDGRLVGIVAKRDLLRHVAATLRAS